MAFVIAIGVKNTGEREVLGFDLERSGDGAFWLAFLRSLAARGLRGVKLAIHDAHEGLRAAIETVLVGSAWQRCRVRDAQYFRSSAQVFANDGVGDCTHHFCPTDASRRETKPVPSGKGLISSVLRFIGILMIASPVLLYGQHLVDEKITLAIFILGVMIQILFRKSKKV